MKFMQDDGFIYSTDVSVIFGGSLFILYMRLILCLARFYERRE